MNLKSLPPCQAVIVAAGSGSRMNCGVDENGIPMNKVFLELAGIPVLAHTLLAFEHCSRIGEIVVVTREYDIAACMSLIDEFGITKVTLITAGGKTRQESVMCGLRGIKNNPELVAIHDGARCLIEPDLIEKVIACASACGASAAGIPCKDSLKRVDGRLSIAEDIAREGVWQVQTPQVFRFAEILDAHRRAAEEGFFATDDSSIAQRYGISVQMVESTSLNLKITTQEDLLLAEAYLQM